MDEPKYSSLYAQLCHRLCEDAPNFEATDSKIPTFRRLLLTKCQDEFENRSKAGDALDKKDGPLTKEEEEQYTIIKHKMLGNIKFIGELGKHEMLHEGILHLCIKQLLEKKKKVAVRDMAEDMECLCQIMRTVGRRLDVGKAKLWMDQYYTRMIALSTHPDLSSRIRFMLQDNIELRRNNWKPRRVGAEINPKTIQEVRQDAARDLGIFLPSDRMGGNRGNVSSNGVAGNVDLFGRPMNGGTPAAHGAGAGAGSMGDVFGQLPSPPYMGGSGNNIGTGPGVIPLDFSPGYSTNMGRNQRNHQGYQRNFDRDRDRERYERPENRRQEGGNGSNQRYQRNERNEGGGTSNQRGRGEALDSRRGEPPRSDRSDWGRGGDADRDSKKQAAPTREAGARELPPRFRRMQVQQPGDSSTQSSQQHLPPWEQDDQQRRSPQPVGGGPPKSLTPPMDSQPLAMQRGGISGGHINLRPASNFNALLRPNTPSMLPKSAQGPAHSNMIQSRDFISTEPRPAPIMQKTPQIKIKQVAAPEKSKPAKKPPTKEELKHNMENMLKNFLETGNMEEAVTAANEMRAPTKFLPDMISHFLMSSLDKSDSERDDVSQLIARLKKDNIVTSEAFIEGLSNVLGQLSSLEAEVPLVRSTVARMAAMAVASGVASLQQLAGPLKGGAHYPLFLLCLQQLHKVRDPEWLQQTFNNSKIDLQSMLPECDRNKERMMEILDDRGLSFLFPLLRVQQDITRQFRQDPSPTALYRWIKDHVDNKLHSNPGFISILINNIFKHVTSETTLAANNEGISEKTLHEKEKAELEKYNNILQRFLHEKIQLQVTAIYSLQLFCHGLGFPKGMLLRIFMQLYDDEVIEEEAFLKWKEEVNDQYPGKGKALFQVNQWLTWLEEAEEESDEEGE